MEAENLKGEHMDAKLVLLLSAVSFSSFANLTDAPVKTIDNTTRETPSSVQAGFIINDDHPKHEFKLETTYGKNSGVISVRTSNGDNNEEVMHVDMASQKELDAERSYTNSQIKAANNAIDGAFDYIQYEAEESKKRDASLQSGINENVKRMTAAEKELYSTTALSKANQSAIGSNSRSIASNTAAIAKNSQDIDTLFSEVNRLDERMDSVIANSHAIANARPYLKAAGQTALGVGVGFAGGKEAIAVGAAHAFTNQLSGSLTISAITGDHSEVSGGAGVQLSF